MTLTHAILFLACVALATCAQNLTGFAFALILLGLAGLMDLAPLADLANVATTLGLTNAIVALRRPGRTMDRAAFRDMAIGGVAGVFLGLALLAWLSSNVVLLLRLLLGLTVMACAIVVLFEVAPLRTRSGAGSFRFFGLLSGTLSGLFAASGPPLVFHLYRQPLDLKTIRDTLVASLAVTSVIRIALVVGTGQFSARALSLTLMAAPLVFGLTWWLERHPPGWSRQAVLRVVCALLLFTGGGLAVPALVQLAGWR